MSFKRQEIVLSQSTTKGPQRLLLMILAHHVNNKNDDGVCWPGHELLAQEMGCDGDTTATVKRVVGQLRKSGEVLISDGRGRAKHNHYLIALGMSEAEVRTIVDDYEKKGIKFDTFYWEQNLEKVSETTPYNEETGPVPEEKGINSDTYSNQKGISFERKGINSDTSMLTESNLNLNTTSTTPPAENFDDGSDLGFPPPDPIFAELCSYYAKHCSPSQTITKHVADKIQAELNDQTPKEWLDYALEVAADNEAHRWSFIQAVLDQIKQAGSLNDHIERRKNGQKNTGVKKSRTNGTERSGQSSTNLTDAYLENNAGSINRKFKSTYRS